MKTKEAIKRFAHIDKKFAKSVFNKKDLRIIFPEESERALDKSISRLISDGVLERVVKGVYSYQYGESMNRHRIENAVRALRPIDFSYVSLESALSEHGLISQIPIDYLTVMTTGRSGVYSTTYGTIEFTHTSRQVAALLDRVIDVEGRPLPMATKDAALADLKRVGRNVNMISTSEV